VSDDDRQSHFETMLEALKDAHSLNGRMAGLIETALPELRSLGQKIDAHRDKVTEDLREMREDIRRTDKRCMAAIEAIQKAAQAQGKAFAANGAVKAAEATMTVRSALARALAAHPLYFVVGGSAVLIVALLVLGDDSLPYVLEWYQQRQEVKN
jgi:Sec-independent protein translocase protein TatA